MFSEFKSLVNKQSISKSHVSTEKLNRITRKNHQGAVAQISPIASHIIEDLVLIVIESGKTQLFLLLGQLSDVRYFGAIIRTEECTGVSGIIFQKMETHQ